MRRFLATSVLVSVRAMSSGGSKVGHPVPAFSAVSHTGITVSRESLAGKGYCLWFYPKADTGG